MNLVKTGSALFSIMLLLTSFSKPEQPDPKFHLYLLVGQSNMAGRGIITARIQLALHNPMY